VTEFKINVVLHFGSDCTWDVALQFSLFNDKLFNLPMVAQLYVNEKITI